MDKKVLNFNKRIALTKKEVHENVVDEKLGSINGTDKTGYHSLSAILKHLHPILDKYDLDLELTMGREQVSALWIDCEGNNERVVSIDFSRISDVPKLSLMGNIVQSEGAVKTYTRRYALTILLGIPSTDIIDGANPQENKKQYNKQNNKPNNQSNKPNNQATSKTPQTPKKVSQAQLKRYFGIMKSKEINHDVMDDCIKVAFGLTSKNDWLVKDYDAFTKFMNGNDKVTIMLAIKNKIERANKKLPMSFTEEQAKILDGETKEAKEVFK